MILIKSAVDGRETQSPQTKLTVTWDPSVGLKVHLLLLDMLYPALVIILLSIYCKYCTLLLHGCEGNNKVLIIRYGHTKLKRFTQLCRPKAFYNTAGYLFYFVCNQVTHTVIAPSPIYNCTVNGEAHDWFSLAQHMQKTDCIAYVCKMWCKWQHTPEDGGTGMPLSLISIG